MADEDEPRDVVIPPDQLRADVLRGLIEEFVTRDGTDYGAVEQSVEQKLAAVIAQLESGEAQLVFDPETETANIVPGRELPEP